MKEKDEDKLQVAKPTNNDVQVRDFEGGLINFLEQHDLPSDNIFVGVSERLNVFKNIDGVISQINSTSKTPPRFIHDRLLS